MLNTASQSLMLFEQSMKYKKTALFDRASKFGLSVLRVVIYQLQRKGFFRIVANILNRDMVVSEFKPHMCC